MTDKLLIELLCFFTVGLLVLSLILSFVLMQVFKQRIFVFYFLYVALTILFIVSVLVTKFNLIPANASWIKLLSFIFEVVQVPLFWCHTFFISRALINETNKKDKFANLIDLYFIFCFCYFIFRLLVGFGIVDIALQTFNYVNTFYWVQYLGIPFLILYRLWQHRANAYLRYLFIGSVTALFFWILTMLNPFFFSNNSFKGFQFLLLGFICDSIFFNLAFIYKSYNTHIDKIKTEFATQAKMVTLHLEVQQQTLQELGKELHDNVGQKLTLASLYTQQLVAQNNAIGNVGEIIDESLQELRNISKSLTSKYIEDNSLQFLLQREIGKIERLKKYTLDIDIDDIVVDSTVKKTIIIRVVQEFFQNAIKYAQCNQLSLFVKSKHQSIDIVLLDDGKGFNYDEKKIYAGSGLSNIKNRITLIEGTLQLTSTISLGTTLHIQIPNT